MSRHRNRFSFDPDCPPRCQTCMEKRQRAGEGIRRLVFRPRTIGICLDCGAVVWDDRVASRRLLAKSVAAPAAEIARP